MSKNVDIRITILMDNTVRVPRLKAEHGWAALVEKGPERLLFDTGQSPQFLENARLLGIDLTGVSKAVLSHGHYDHSGGLPEFLRLNSRALVYAHPGVLITRFSRPPGETAREIGIPRDGIDARRLVLTSEPVSLFAGCLTTGEIPRGEYDPASEGHFYEDREGSRLDLIGDDQALILESGEGLIVILGCCHSGLKATLDRVRAITDETSVFMVLGGLHLADASDRLMEQTARALREYSVRSIGLSHCTGHRGSLFLLEEFPGRCFPANTGLKIQV
ncbi:MAG: MBL fold metallo-hydrolase [Syntrophomonadaceae bacterium]|nr:MBL fold metallo-hydrolase [Syntrophomonadaceae bacterium]